MSKENYVPIGISNRHIHISRDDLAVLFGKDYQLTRTKDLSQPGQFACEETLEIIGPKASISKVRILGPVRKETQVEISKTDCYTLGVDAPVRDSGDLEGTPGIRIRGPQGEIDLKKGLICAKRHLHLSTSDGIELGLKDKDVVSIEVQGEKGLVFKNVLVRVGDQYAKDFHIDTDEANAAGIMNGDKGLIIK